MKEPINEDICPFCGAKNNCMAHSEDPCWCFEVTIPQALQNLIPEISKGKSCICISCIEAFHENPDQFTIDKNLSTNRYNNNHVPALH